MSCKGICQQFIVKTNKYDGTNSRCITCDSRYFLGIVDVFCPCCGNRLRRKSRTKPYVSNLKKISIYNQ